jgi:diguanylate cyclase (GGDEF)-like protein
LALLCERPLAATQSSIAAERNVLNSQVHYLEDTDGSRTLKELLGGTESWRQNGEQVFNKGFSRSVWWLKLDLHGAQTHSSKRLLEIGNPLLDKIDLHVIQDGQVLQSYQTGDKLPFHNRPLTSRNFVVPLHLPQSGLSIYIRIQTASSTQVPVILWQEDAFLRHQANNNFLQGLYSGGTFTIVIYNLLIFVTLRDRSYLYYVGFVVSAPLYFLALKGLGFRYIWPDIPAWNDHAIPVFLSCLVIFGALFTRRFLELKKISSAVDYAILAFAVIGAAALVMSFYLPYQNSIILLVATVIFACIADMAAGIYAWHRQVVSARFYVLAWSAFLLGSMVFSFNKLNILPSNMFTENAVQVGSILEAILLSFAMADRINFERRMRFKAQAENLAIQIRANETLEMRVAERTQELVELNRKLQELSYTDPLTQSYNRRYLEEGAAREWQRCLRKSTEISVLMLDIDHFKQVNDRFGHDIGDYCLQEVAKLLRELLRPTDIVARYGGEEFCVVLPETNSADAMQVAQRILVAITNMTLRTEKGDIFIAVSIGVSNAKPHSGMVLQTLFTESDAALYAAKSAGKNRANLFSAHSQI